MLAVAIIANVLTIVTCSLACGDVVVTADLFGYGGDERLEYGAGLMKNKCFPKSCIMAL